ncbi:MAG: DUF928 domain-containing protein [Coleofasciculaceae cyanobacterium]
MIIPIQGFLNKCLKITLVTSCTLSLALIVTLAALADYVPGEQQPVPSNRRSDGGTTRGCSGGDMPLTVLASRNYVGRTISQHPTFAWFVPPDSADKKMKFTIYEWVQDGKAKQVYEKEWESSSGVMKLSPFSENEPGLEVGKEYAWQVVIICDPSSLSSAIVDRVSIEVVATPPEVQSKLNKAVNSVEKVNIYAEAGLWYDSLAEALKLVEPPKLGEVGSDLLKDLAQWEAQKSTSELSLQELEVIEKRIQNLEQIADRVR